MRKISTQRRTSDHERWNMLDFVVGVEVRLSDNHTLNGRPFTDICDYLAGKYPKDFKFTGWHPQCRCYAIPILKTTDEMFSDAPSENEVKDMPENFKKWVEANAEKIQAAEERGKLPYFLKDNKQFIKYGNNDNLSDQVKKLTNKGEYNMIVSGKVNPASLKSDFLNLLDNNITINIVNKPESGSSWSPKEKTVTLDTVQRRVASEWFNKALVYHEGGHSIADMRGLFQTKEFKDMMIKHIKLVEGDKAKLIDDRLRRLRLKIVGMKDDVFTKRGITKDDVREQILGAADTLSALTKEEYGWGHQEGYYLTASKRRHEYIAHAFENYFAGNTVFKKIMPKMYKDMIKYIGTLISQ